jgi:aminoglycoside phosphotransferase (APT) family kinase protein
MDRPEARVRAVGRRLPFDAVPEPVRAWVTRTVGDVVVAREHRGGMSPGCATSLRTADGSLVFVKAVGAEQNPQTVERFRYDTRILRQLPPAPYRPGLLADYDRDGWAALLLEHVDGRHPDLGGTLDHRAAAELIAAQVAELTPPPAAGATPLAESARRWARRWNTIAADPADYLPAWAAARADEMLARVRRLPDRLPPQTLCHFDVRDDNLLVRPDGTAAILDWGMARLGPSWADPLLLAMQNSTDTTGRAVRTLTPAEQEAAVDLLTALGGSQAWNARQPAPPGLPHLAAFCADDATRLLAAAEALS